ncbi:histidine kinase N-terminal 7TM domain-containing diguanylate cyclase [Paenibacillus soyae]|uniref:Diguanylate cyclase n=1 Tax=Paenibacillus soyae TaxID=2969249 RepID=A0A9X2MPN3_9BACL|nr:histidine kinase N-terminal 7TM domain-containing protein [Paenibacillus soyae]MCR2804551.1 diguanylate cyclase [Paenibacillus soyae]
METRLTMYITLVVTSGVMSAFLCMYAIYKRKDVPDARNLILLTALQSIYIFGFAFELASDSLAEIKRWIIVEYLGIAFAPVVGLMLVLRYMGKAVPRPWALAMYAIPLTTIALVSTNDVHGLFYKDIYLRENTPSPMADIVVGEWYIVHGAYTFGCLLAGGILLILQWKKTNKAYRKQLFTLICGQFIPMTASFLYLMGITPDGMDVVPFVLCITSAMYLWALLSTQMLRISPIAKESLFESMREGVLVLDLSERLIDYNPAAGRMLPELGAPLVGLTLDSVWKRMAGTEFPIERGLGGINGHLRWTSGGKTSEYEVRSSLIKKRAGDTFGSLLMLIDFTEQRMLQEQLKRQAYYDSLTGALNRARFVMQARALLQEKAPSRMPVSLILFDIDHFKRFNDTYGHETGDAVLVHVAAVCREVIEEGHLFARYGGEEFVIAMPDATLEEACEFAGRLRDALAEEPLLSKAGSLSVTASFGVTASRDGADSLDELLRQADEGLYEAKRRGRDQVVAYNKKELPAQHA